MVDSCNFRGCPNPPTVKVVDQHGHVEEMLCLPCAIATAQGQAARVKYIDAASGREILRVLIQVTLGAAAVHRPVELEPEDEPWPSSHTATGSPNNLKLIFSVGLPLAVAFSAGLTHEALSPLAWLPPVDLAMGVLRKVADVAVETARQTGKVEIS